MVEDETLTQRTEPTDFAEPPPGMVPANLATGLRVEGAVWRRSPRPTARTDRGPPISPRRPTPTPARCAGAAVLVSVGVFNETSDGAFALTPIGDCMRKDVPGSFRAATLLFAGPLEWASWSALPHSVETGEMALRHVFGVGPFEYMHQHPDESATFDEAMAAFTSMTALAVAAAYDFQPFREVVDVGGGNGAFADRHFLKANAHLRGIVFDQPQVANGATKQIAAANLADVVAPSAATSSPRFLRRRRLTSSNTSSTIGMTSRPRRSFAPVTAP